MSCEPPGDHGTLNLQFWRVSNGCSEEEVVREEVGREEVGREEGRRAQVGRQEGRRAEEVGCQEGRREEVGLEAQGCREQQVSCALQDATGVGATRRPPFSCAQSSLPFANHRWTPRRSAADAIPAVADALNHRWTPRRLT